MKYGVHSYSDHPKDDPGSYVHEHLTVAVIDDGMHRFTGDTPQKAAVAYLDDKALRGIWTNYKLDVMELAAAISREDRKSCGQ